MSLPRWRRFLHFSVRHMKDYYKMLGVAKTADEGEIRQAYYKARVGCGLARIHD